MDIHIIQRNRRDRMIRAWHYYMLHYNVARTYAGRASSVWIAASLTWASIRRP